MFASDSSGRIRHRYVQMRRDAVKPEMHDRVIMRDGICFVKLINPEHVCGDGTRTHASTDLRKLTVDHVWHIPGGIRGKRAPSDERHLTAMCWQANFDGPSRAVRQAQREYLTSLYGETEY